MALALLALAALPRLAERAALAALRARGVEGAKLEIVSLGPSGAELRDLALPPAISVGHIAVDYSLAGLLARRVDRLEVSDAALEVVFTPRGPSLGPLDGLLAARGAPGAGAAWGVRELTVRGARVRAGDFELQVEAVLRSEDAGGARAEAKLALRQAGVDAGAAQLELRADRPFERIGSLAELADALELHGRLELSLRPFDAEGLGRGIAAQGAAVLSHADGRGSLSLPGGMELRAASLAAPLRARLPGLGGADALWLRVARDSAAALRWSRDPAAPLAQGAWRGDLDVDARAEAGSAGAPAAELSVRAHAALEGSREEMRVRVPECAMLSVSRLRLRGLELSAPTALCVKTAAAPLVVGLGAAPRASFDAELATARPLRLRGAKAEVFSAEAVRVALRGEAAERALRAHVAVSSRRPRLPGALAAADALAADAELTRQDGLLRADGTLHAGGLRFARSGRAFAAPLDADARFSLAGGALRFELDGRHAASLEISGKGRHDFATGRGQIALELAPLRFGAEAPAPAELFPPLAGFIQSARGGLSAKAQLAWPASPLGTLELSLDGLALKGADFDVRGLSGVVRFDDLHPLRTAPSQFLTFERLASGLELASGGVAFTLAPDGHLDVHAAEGLWAGGWVRARGRIDPGESEHRFALELNGIPLGQLAQLADVEGLSASGHLLGEVPIRVSQGRVFLDGARLEAEPEGGRIRYKPRVPPTALQSAGSGGAFALAALENFHYEALGASVRGDAAEALEAEVYLYGANPDVAGGRPIELHLRFQGPGGAALAKSLQGLWLPQRLVPALGGLFAKPR